MKVIDFFKNLFGDGYKDPMDLSHFDENTRNQYRAVFKKTYRKIKAQEQATTAYTDEDFFEVIENLPDRSFKLVASKIYQISDVESERGCKWSLSEPLNDIEQIKADTNKLLEMGLISWDLVKDKSCYMDFNVSLINGRLAKRQDLVDKLRESANNRGMKNVVR